jgi:hypothetical protein
MIIFILVLTLHITVFPYFLVSEAFRTSNGPNLFATSFFYLAVSRTILQCRNRARVRARDDEGQSAAVAIEEDGFVLSCIDA